MEMQERLRTKKQAEDFVRECKLQMPEEVATLFEEYTRLIWQHHCPGEIYRYYCDETVVHGAGGNTTKGIDRVVAGSLGFMRSFPDRICDFVDIFAEGDPENGYQFGQSTRRIACNTGYSQYGPPTGKELGAGADGDLYCICECHVRKVEGRWRIIEEWTIESAEATRAALIPDPPATEACACDCSACNEEEEAPTC